MDPREAIITAATVVEALIAGPLNGGVDGLAGLRQDEIERNRSVEISRVIQDVPGEPRPR
jgi:hypothetical protein